MGEFDFPRIHRITSTHDYRKVYRDGRRIPSAHFLLFVLPSGSGISRIGLSAGRKLGNAVVRNRVKRRMREIMRRLRPGFTTPAELVIIAHAGAAALSFAEMERELNAMLRSARLLP